MNINLDFAKHFMQGACQMFTHHNLQLYNPHNIIKIIVFEDLRMA